MPACMLKVQCALRLTWIVNKSTIFKQPASDLALYGRPLSIAWAKSMHVMFYECYFIYLFFMAALCLGPGYRGSRNFYTWWTLSVNREVTTWIFSWSSLNYRDGPKSDEIWHIFRPRPQTFCSHARTRQNIVILKKNLLSTDGCSTRVPGLVNFGLQTPEIHASY